MKTNSQKWYFSSRYVPLLSTSKIVKGYLKLFIPLLLFTLIQCTTTQRSADSNGYPRSAQKQYQKAKAAQSNFQSDKAEKKLIKTISIYANHVEARRDLIAMYIRAERYDEALIHTEYLFNQSLDTSANLQFIRTRLYWETNQFEQCELSARQLLNEGNISEDIILNAAKYQRDAAFTIYDRKQDVSEPTARKLPDEINSEFKEYFPFITADGRQLVFTRRVNLQERIYRSKQNEDGQWLEASIIFDEQQTANQGALCISADGKTIYYTMCNISEGYGSCDIYYRTLKGGEWEPPRNLGPTVNTNAWESQPALAPDGRTLYFVSNRPGGEGGMDIWYSRKNAKGQWSEAQNIGSGINTPMDEMTPYIHFDNETIYFSSAGYAGFGGLDLFMTKKNGDSFMPPINLGNSINSKQDESGLIVDRDGRTAYMAKVDERLDRSDIYQVQLSEMVQAKSSTYVQFYLTDKVTQAPVRGVIEVLDLETDKRHILAQADIEGQLLVTMPEERTYAVNIFHPEYIFHSAYFDVLSEEEADFPQLINIALLRVRDVPYDTTEGPEIVLENVFFESASSKLKPSSVFELDKLADWLKIHQSIVIRIEGHTDSIGQYEDNLQLSRKRAFAVKQYLEDQGVSAERLMYEGYADTRPIADNETPEGRAKNRRTAFVILRGEK